jgi:hypothetical protein
MMKETIEHRAVLAALSPSSLPSREPAGSTSPQCWRAHSAALRFPVSPRRQSWVTFAYPGRRGLTEGDVAHLIAESRAERGR